MIRREVAARLLKAGYIPELDWSPDAIWNHPKGKCRVQINYGGSVTVWYANHSKYLQWSSRLQEFVQRSKQQL